MIEHAGQELRIAGGAADFVGANASRGEEATEVLRLGGEVGQRLDSEPFGRLAAGAVFAASGFAVFHGGATLLASLAIRWNRFRKIGCELVTV